MTFLSIGIHRKEEYEFEMAQSKQKYAFRYLSVGRQYMTTHQVAEDMGITTTTVAAWVYRHGMPCRGAGNLFLFVLTNWLGG